MYKFLLFLLPLLSFAFEGVGGSVNGNAKLYYYDIDKSVSSEDSFATSLGGDIEYKTDKLWRFGVVIGAAASNAIFGELNPKGTALFNNDYNEAKNLTALSDAHLFYQNSKTYFKFGAQKIDTPLLNYKSARVVPWSYKAASMLYKPIENLALHISYVSHIRSRTSSKYSDMSASGEIDGIYILGFKDDFTKDTSLSAYYYNVSDLYDSIFSQFEHNIVIDSELLYCFGIQYIYTQKSGGSSSHATTINVNGGDDVNLISGKIGVYYKEYQGQIAYSQNFGLSGIDKGYGGTASLYTTSLMADGKQPYKPYVYSLKNTYDIFKSSNGNSEAGIDLTKIQYDDSRGKGSDAWYIYFHHHFNIDTAFYLQYQEIDFKDNSEAKYTRFIVEYTF